MVFFSEHDGVTFRWSEVDQSYLHGWYDDLPAGELKSSIVKIVRRDAGRTDSPADLTVACRHPFADLATALEAASHAGDEAETTLALNRLSAAFSIWSKVFGATSETLLEGVAAYVSWLPVELTRNDPQERSPQALAVDEMNERVGNCLSAIFAAEEPGGIERCRYEGSNDAFISAGAMLTGDMNVLLRRFPATFPRDGAAIERFRENLVENAEFFLTLVRMAQRVGHRSTLMDRLLRLFVAFSDEHRTDFLRWHEYKVTRYKVGGYFLSAEELVQNDVYTKIDEAGEELTSRLLAAVDGCEHEIAPMVNSFLPELPIPDSPMRARFHDERDWR